VGGSGFWSITGLPSPNSDACRPELAPSHAPFTWRPTKEAEAAFEKRSIIIRLADRAGIKRNNWFWISDPFFSAVIEVASLQQSTVAIIFKQI